MLENYFLLPNLQKSTKRYILLLGSFSVALVMRDEMKILPKDKKPIYVVTNIHTSKENGADDSYFFDLYGLPPTKEVKKFIGNGICSTFKIQEDGTKYYGQMSLYVLRRLNQRDKFTDIVLSLHKK